MEALLRSAQVHVCISDPGSARRISEQYWPIYGVGSNICNRPGLKWDHQQGIFEDATRENPTKHLLWVMYAQQAPDVAMRISLYEQGLRQQLESLDGATEADPEQSYRDLPFGPNASFCGVIV